MITAYGAHTSPSCHQEIRSSADRTGPGPMRCTDHPIRAKPRIRKTIFTMRIRQQSYKVRAIEQGLDPCGMMRGGAIMIRRALSCQAAVLVGMASLLLITYLGLALIPILRCRRAFYCR